MIDRDRIDRHLIVKKENELTTISEASVSNVIDEEVLYNALGYSIFETLQKKNIVFEGWRDKKLFQAALSRIPTEFKGLRKSFDDIGLCHAKGVSDVERITPILELANRSWVVVSDSDKMAREYQRDYKGKGTWYRYDELLGDSNILTGEDFVKPEAIRSAVKKFTEERSGLTNLDFSKLDVPKGRIGVIRQWLQENGVAEKDDLRQSMDRFKSILFDDLKPSSIEIRYYTFLQQLAGVVEQMEARN
jgi:hypothetical protein